MCGKGRRHGCADYAGGVSDHEGHFFGRHVAGGDYQVAFVFAGGGIEDDDEFAIFWGKRLVKFWRLGDWGNGQWFAY